MGRCERKVAEGSALRVTGCKITRAIWIIYYTAWGILLYIAGDLYLTFHTPWGTYKIITYSKCLIVLSRFTVKVDNLLEVVKKLGVIKALVQIAGISSLMWLQQSVPSLR